MHRWKLASLQQNLFTESDADGRSAANVKLAAVSAVSPQRYQRQRDRYEPPLFH